MLQVFRISELWGHILGVGGRVVASREPADGAHDTLGVLHRLPGLARAERGGGQGEECWA
jgi:hypothetical protein